MSNPSQFVLTFLESIGRRSDAEYYLRLFRQLPKPSFAVIAAEPDVYREAQGSLLEALRFLVAMGLYPVVALGLLGENEQPIRDQLLAGLAQRGLPIVLHGDAARDAARIEADLSSERLTLVEFPESDARERFAALASLLGQLRSRKLVLLRSRGGLGPKDGASVALSRTHQLPTTENGISIVNLRTDLGPLRAGRWLSEDEQWLLQQLERVHQSAPALLTNITSPLNLLRELFTVRGAGTLIKTGSAVLRADSYSALDLQRLKALLESAFKRAVRAGFEDVAPLDIYYEAEYRGAAIVLAANSDFEASFLTKFAVDRKAQGEGIGRDLWEALSRDHPALYWRARKKNPISAWYAAQCDGLQQVGEWCVYWRGVHLKHVPNLIADALSRPDDFMDP